MMAKKCDICGTLYEQQCTPDVRIIDREKVIKGLETCYCPPAKCEDCPYHDLPVEKSCNDTLCLDVLELLKEQEAVEPICQIIFDVPYYFCGSCKTMLNMYAVKAKYCSNCARRVKWNESNNQT